MSWFLTKEENRFLSLMNDMPFESWVRTDTFWLNKELNVMIDSIGYVKFYKLDVLGKFDGMTAKVHYGRKVRKLFKALNKKQLALEVAKRCEIGDK